MHFKEQSCEIVLFFLFFGSYYGGLNFEKEESKTEPVKSKSNGYQLHRAKEPTCPITTKNQALQKTVHILV